MRLIFLLTCLLLLTGGCAPQAVDTPTPALPPTPTADLPTFELTSCQMETPASLEMRCGWVSVPENRTQPAGAGNRIRLAVSVLRARRANPRLEPIFLLAGGPGDGAIDGLVKIYLDEEKRLRGEDVELISAEPEEAQRQHRQSYQIFVDMLKRHPYVLVDQRGTGRSQPSLDCAQGEELPDCFHRLRQAGVDLSSYNTRENAADLDAVRRALRYTKVNLYGGSYGTRLGFEILRLYPQTIHAAVLDGVAPLHIPFEVEMARRFDQTVGLVFQHCQADPGCAAAYPDLEERFYRTVSRLNARPVTLDLQPGEWEFDGDSLAQMVWHGMYYQESLAYLPQLIWETSNGEYTTARNFIKGMAEALADNHEGMRFSVLCAEQADFQTRAQVEQAAGGLRPEVRAGVANEWSGLFHICEQWLVQPAGASFHQPVSSDVPVLLSSGEFDPATPPDFAHDAARSLSRVTDLVFPGIGHINLFASACKTGIIADFFDHPNLQPDTSCIQEMGLRFALPAQEP